MTHCGATAGNCASTWLLPANGGHGTRRRKAAVLTAKLSFGIFATIATVWARSQRRLSSEWGIVSLIVAGTYIVLSSHSLSILIRNARRPHP